MYASPDLEVCVHECRVTAEDEFYVATLAAVSSLRLLDLSVLLTHEDTTEFESLDMALHKLFLAGPHSYPTIRKISLAAHSAGFDGLVYPSYFSMLRVGAMPFETVFGIASPRIPHLQDYERAKTVSNLAIFGRPVRCIDKLIIQRVKYDFHFAPVGFA